MSYQSCQVTALKFHLYVKHELDQTLHRFSASVSFYQRYCDTVHVVAY